MGVAILGHAEDVKAAGDQMGELTQMVKATMVAGGASVRNLTHAQAMAALEEAERSLQFIAKMEIDINGVKQVEPVSRFEARVALARILKAIEGAQG